MNILVTGGSGQLGKEVKIASVGLPESYTFFFTDVDDLDVCNKEAIKNFCLKNSINLIINCAAYTNVDQAESNADIADKINHVAVRNLAEVAHAANIFIFHISTDYVFGGNKNTPFSENDSVKPLGVYGLTKRKGEEALISSGCKYIIIRTAWLYSWHSKNFLLTMLKLTSSKAQLKVVYDQVGTPTNAQDLAEFITHVINEKLFVNHEGIYHFTNEGVCSWFDFAWEINRLSSFNCNVKSCSSNEFPTVVKRPSYSVLDKSKVKAIFKYSIPYWKESLALCINKINKNENI